MHHPHFNLMRRLRRDLHEHPELSWDEHQSTKRLVETLVQAGLPEPTTLSCPGLILDLPGQNSGPFIALRADLDALPITEDNGLPFQSKERGVMHACGHDAHSAMLVGAALRLFEAPAALPVRLFWQPAEELGTGAPKMISQGVLNDVAMVFSGHVDRRWGPNTVAIERGAVNASTDTFCIVISGGGGHGARPHLTVDPIVVAAHLVTQMQTVVSRSVPPGEPAVVTVGELIAGTAPNIIASDARLTGTLRAHCPKVRALLKERLRTICSAVASSFAARVRLTVEEGSPPVINKNLGTSLALKAAKAMKVEITTMPHANLGGEDFAFYLEQRPGCFIRFGSAPPQGSGPAHSPSFLVDEGVLSLGATWLEHVARLAAEHVLQSTP